MKFLALPFVVSLLTTISASPVIKREVAVVTESTLADLEFFAQYAAAAYCNTGNSVGDAITCASDACPTVEANGAVTVATFAGELTDIRGFVAVDTKTCTIVVSYRGSSSARNWLANLNFIMSPCDLVDDCYSHTGFLIAWEETSAAVVAAVAAARALHPTFRVVATGHSLGGAVAALAAAHLRLAADVDLVTYGSPRVGNEAFARFVTEQPGAEYRVTHVDDPVPRLPPAELGYRHTSPEYWLSTGNATTTVYGVADVKVCKGYADMECNGGTDGLNVDAHMYYFVAISGCNDPGMGSAQAFGAEYISDEELAARIDAHIEIAKQANTRLEAPLPPAT